MKREIDYKGMTLTDSANVPEWYFEATGHDILEDAVADEKTKKVNRPSILYLGLLTALLLASSGSPSSFDEAEKKEKIEAAKEKFSMRDLFNPRALEICNSVVSDDDPKKAEAEVAEEPQEDPASLSTPSGMPLSSGSQSDGSIKSLSKI